LLSGAGNRRAFTLTSAGVLTSIYTFPTNSEIYQWEVQAVNGQVYGSQINPDQNFSLNTSGSFTYYTPAFLNVVPILSVQLPDGNIYGTTLDVGGVQNRTFVRMNLSGAVTVMHTFTAQEGDPIPRPILASDGNFYGMSGIGDSYESTSALVYELSPNKQFKVLKTYADGRKNYAPATFPEALVEVGKGNLFGTAALGGSNRGGAIFELSTTGAYKVIHEFKDWKFGVPTVMTLATDGNLYGVALGQVQLGGLSSLFRVTPSGQFETLYSFTNAAIGLCACYLTQGSDGKFYGISQNGGVGVGTAWVWDLGLPKPLPSLAGFIPSSSSSGARVTLYGTNLLGATSVSFNGVPASSFSNITGNYVSATVPAGATTGPVTVTTPNGTATSPKAFTIH